ncbi:MAG TPA: hypothetical protein ENH52_11670, partial [Nitrospirae bacterium]|nr:hypothetical protein [Nitrospirota bacterium]
MKNTFKIINAVLLCTWLTLLVILLYRQYYGSPFDDSMAAQSAFGSNKEWYDIYMGKDKTGLASTIVEKAGNDIIIRHERRLKVLKGGKKTELVEKLKCLCDKSLSIRNFEYTSHIKGERGIKATGDVDRDEVTFILESPKKRKTYRTPTGGKKFYLPITIIPAIQREHKPVNQPFTVPLLNLADLRIRDVKVVLKEIRPINFNGNVVSIYKYLVENMVVWCNTKGHIIKEEDPRGLTLYGEPEAVAEDPKSRPILDYTNIPFFRSNRHISGTTALKTLRVKISGFRLNPKLYRDSDVTLRDSTLMIRKQGPEDIRKDSYHLPYRRAGLDTFISADKWINSDYEPLNNTGRIYARSNNDDAYALTEYLTSYVFNLVRPFPVFALRDSKAIL